MRTDVDRQRQVMDAALQDPELAAMMVMEGEGMEPRSVPMEMASYTVADKADGNCGSQCGCDADKGVGCGEDTHGENDKGGDCPYQKG